MIFTIYSLREPAGHGTVFLHSDSLLVEALQYLLGCRRGQVDQAVTPQLPPAREPGGRAVQGRPELSYVDTVQTLKTFTHLKDYNLRMIMD